MKVSLGQSVREVPTRHGNIVFGVSLYWDFGKKKVNTKSKLYGIIAIDCLIWTLTISFRGGV